MKKKLLILSGFLLILIWFAGGLWIIRSTNRTTENWSLPLTNIPVNYQGMSCDLSLQAGSLVFEYPARLPAGKKKNEIFLHLKPSAQNPFLWSCADPGLTAVFDQNLDVYLGIRINIPQATLTPSAAFTRPFLSGTPVEHSWNIQVNQADITLPFEFWVDALILQRGDEITEVMQGASSPVEKWSWLVKNSSIRSFSVLGLPYDLTLIILFGSLASGVFILIMLRMISAVQRRKTRSEM